MPWVQEVLQGSPAITQVENYTDAGITNPQYGHVITLRTGARVSIQWVRTSPPTGDQSEEETVVTGERPALQTLQELPASGRTPLRDIERHLVALIANAAHEGNPEVRSVEQKSVREDAGLRPCCVIVRMHNGSQIFGLFRSLAPAGASISSGGESFQQREEV
uniref:hypothetical protein n=1 Tax=Actinomadura sp. CA-154981 TaxID=3240037 RepID=UPI003F497EA9